MILSCILKRLQNQLKIEELVRNVIFMHQYTETRIFLLKPKPSFLHVKIDILQMQDEDLIRKWFNLGYVRLSIEINGVLFANCNSLLFSYNIKYANACWVKMPWGYHSKWCSQLMKTELYFLCCGSQLIPSFWWEHQQ